MFKLKTNSNVDIGNGFFNEFCQKLNNDKYKNILFFVDSGFSQSKYWKSILDIIIKKIDFNYDLYDISNKFEPTYQDLEIHRSDIEKKNPDLIIACGGGSTMDLAKALAVLINNRKNSLEYRGFDKIVNKGIDTVLVPTTGGTGSEASYNASFIDNFSNKKLGINGNFMFPTYSILDGKMLSSCPKSVAVSSAVDVLTHVLEGYVCNNSNDFSDMFAEKSFFYLVNNLSRIEEINQPEVGLEFLKAAHLSGIVQMNAGSGIAAAISYPLGVYYKVPHGIGGGIFLLDIARYNIKNGYDKYSNLIKFCNLTNKMESSLDLIDYLQYLFDSIGIPKKLTSFGITKKDKSKIYEIMQTQQLAFNQNPIGFSCTLDFSDLIDNYLE